MKKLSTIVLVLAATGSLIAFGYCLAIHCMNTFQPLFNALGGIL